MCFNPDLEDDLWGEKDSLNFTAHSIRGLFAETANKDMSSGGGGFCDMNDCEILCLDFFLKCW